MCHERVDIIIVNYRTPHLVIDCLESLRVELAEHVDWRVFVVENNSGDGSESILAKAISTLDSPEQIRLMVLESNRGFAAGNNAALRQIMAEADRPDYVLLLNPDTIARPRAVGSLVQFMREHPTAGIAGSRLEDPDTTPQQSAFRFPSALSEFENGLRLGLASRLLCRWVVAPPVRNDAHTTDWVAGASMIVRREVFEAIGLMDEGYFLYYEELDFCYAARKAGWFCWYVPDSRVVHLVGRSSGINAADAQKRRVPSYLFASRKRFFSKNYGRLHCFIANAAWAIGFALWRVRSRMQAKPNTDPPEMLRDFLRHNFYWNGKLA